MRSRPRILSIALALAVLSGSFFGLARAQGPEGGQAAEATYSIPWYTVDGGGGTSSEGDYTLSGTAGQPDAGTLAGGGYTLTGGFWYTQPARAIWMPMVIK